MIQLKGIIIDGKLIPNNSEKHESMLSKLEGKTVYYYIDDTSSFTKNQMGYYRALNTWLSKDTEAFGGWDTNDIHQFAATLFASEKKTYFIDGKKMESLHVESLSQMTKQRMSEFIDSWVNWLSIELEIIVPQPEDFAVMQKKSLPGQSTKEIYEESGFDPVKP